MQQLSLRIAIVYHALLFICNCVEGLSKIQYKHDSPTYNQRCETCAYCTVLQFRAFIPSFILNNSLILDITNNIVNFQLIVQIRYLRCHCWFNMPIVCMIDPCMQVESGIEANNLLCSNDSMRDSDQNFNFNYLVSSKENFYEYSLRQPLSIRKLWQQ